MKHWRWEKDAQGLAWLTFDKAGESANTFSRDVSLRRAVVTGCRPGGRSSRMLTSRSP